MITTLGTDTVLIWGFRPQSEYVETIEFSTDVLPSFSAEQRVSLRTKPRQRLSQPYILDASQYAQVKSFMQAWGANLFAVPVWHEQTGVGSLTTGATEILFDTANADYRDAEYALVWQSDAAFEAVTITTVLSDRITLTGTLQSDYTNAFVMPLRKARMPNLKTEAQRASGQYVQGSASFVVTDNSDLSAQATPYTTHSGYQVMEDRPIVIGSVDESIIWPQEVFDNGTGVIGTDTQRSQTFLSSMVSWKTMCGSPTLWSIRTWLHSIRGRAIAFWMPSYQPDMTVTTTIGSADTSITITDINFATYYDTAEIMILLKDGTRYYRSVTASVDNGNGTESLTIAALGTTVTAAEIDMVSIMKLSRLDSDRIEISHSGITSSVRIPVIEVPVPV